MQYVRKHKIKNPVIGILGVSYKKNVDDARETPASAIIEALRKEKLSFLVHDPYVKAFSTLLSPLNEVLAKADALLLITDHDEYAKLVLPKRSPVKFIYDTRNVLPHTFNVPVYTLGNAKNI